jgi:ABC-type proline/glycine betaine transport system ATPase subunit
MALSIRDYADGGVGADRSSSGQNETKHADPRGQGPAGRVRDPARHAGCGERRLLHIEEGEVLGVVGESGAGKSLPGAAVIGLLEPPGRIAQGEVLLDGERIDHLPYERLRRLRGKGSAWSSRTR